VSVLMGFWRMDYTSLSNASLAEVCLLLVCGVVQPLPSQALPR